MIEKFETRLYGAETLLEAFEVLKEMFETLMVHVGDLRPSALEHVDFLDLGLGAQNETKNCEQTIATLQAEIKQLTKLQHESSKEFVEIRLELESAQKELKIQEEAAKVRHPY